MTVTVTVMDIVALRPSLTFSPTCSHGRAIWKVPRSPLSFE